jgi:hypothetical protein
MNRFPVSMSTLACCFAPCSGCLPQTAAMTSRLAFEDRPSYQLTIHFFRGLFDFGVLSDAGSDTFRRMLLGLAALTVMFEDVLPSEVEPLRLSEY